MKKIYISGRITGLSIDVATKIFNNAEALLRKTYKCEIINPMAAVIFEKGKTWEQYMLEDIEILFKCDAIFMMNNWKASKGACIEHAIAREIGLIIMYQEKRKES